MKQINFETSQTKVNLARAFAGECQDGARYQFLATKAEENELYYLKYMLKTLAKNEMAHAKVFYDLICDNCPNQQHNIEITAGYPFECAGITQSIYDSLQTEQSQSKNIYPSFAKIAKDEGFNDVAKKFELCATVENCHFLLLQQLYNKLKSNSLYKSATNTKWKCSNCGFEHTAKTPWTNCPSCSFPKGYVEISIDVGDN